MHSNCLDLSSQKTLFSKPVGFPAKVLYRLPETTGILDGKALCVTEVCTYRSINSTVNPSPAVLTHWMDLQLHPSQMGWTQTQDVTVEPLEYHFDGMLASATLGESIGSSRVVPGYWLSGSSFCSLPWARSTRLHMDWVTAVSSLQSKAFAMLLCHMNEYCWGGDRSANTAGWWWIHFLGSISSSSQLCLWCEKPCHTRGNWGLVYSVKDNNQGPWWHPRHCPFMRWTKWKQILVSPCSTNSYVFHFTSETVTELFCWTV